MSRSKQLKTQEQTTVGHHFLMTLFYTLLYSLGKEMKFTLYLIVTLIQQDSSIRFCYIQGGWDKNNKGMQGRELYYHLIRAIFILFFRFSLFYNQFVG